ncbi:fluoroquinolone export ABC transporter permease subunit [Halomarina pelagica]|uniref:fluoroquinolone export ABC transporter permease subunit n=1 Tax=Halomarina pelagica TaxID=2961599 RepID=UPI0020C40B49|nr:ATP-binding cassette domain-containing protein [Halomarina sp. BND7]
MIGVRGLRFTYPGAESATLRGLDFSVDAGEVFGFLGPSGAGKSTTQRVLTGLLDGYEGSVRVLGREVAEWDGGYYERIGVSGESPNHYPKLTGRENLELFASLYRGETRDVEGLFELVGLDDALDRRVAEYSNGMRMRLNFVRALLHDPDVLLLDEPTSGIDPGNARTVKGAISDLRDEGRAIFLTTHDMTVADQLCDRVAFLVDGRIATVDAPDRLKREYGSRTVRVEYRRGGTRGTERFPLDGLGESAAFRRLLADGRVETIHTDEATLEDVFLRNHGGGARVRSATAMLAWDVRLQLRYGFYAVYAVLAAAYAVLLGLLPPRLVEPALVFVVVSDAAVLGFYFIAALVLVERREGVLDALVVSPLGARGYLASKTASLTILAVLVSTLLAVVAHRGTNVALLIVGVALTSVFFVLVGFVAVARFDSINAYFFSAPLYGVILYAPLLGYFGVYETPAFYLLPVQPALLLVGGAFGGIDASALLYGVGYLSIGSAAAFVLAERRFERYVVRGEGSRPRAARRTPGRIGRGVAARAGTVAGMVLADLRNWARDPILLLAASGPLLLAVVARVGLPLVDRLYLPGASLTGYYPLVLGFLVLFPPYVYGVVVGFLMLEDREQGTLAALRTTPLTAAGYLRYRGASAYFVSAALVGPTAALFGLFAVPLRVLIPVALVAALAGPAIAFLFAGLARDSIEGVAINKLLGLVVVLPIAGVLLLPEPVEYLAGIVPLYWPVKALLVAADGDAGPAFVAALALGSVSLGASVYLLARRFVALAT